MTTLRQRVFATYTAALWEALVKNLHLDPDTFQLVQGALPVGTTSSELWSLLDAIPGLSVNHLYNPGTSNLFSTDYGGVILNLKSSPVVDAAVTTWHDAGGFDSTKAYNQTVGDLLAGLPQTPGAKFTFDTGTYNASPGASVEHGWARGRIQIPTTPEGSESPGKPEDRAVRFVELRGAPKVAEAPGVEVTVSMTHVLTFPAGPLSQAEPFDPILRNFSPWYNSAALNLAYQNRGGSVWRAGKPPSWTDTFGKAGNMLRRAVSLLVVDGYKVETSLPKGLDPKTRKLVEETLEKALSRDRSGVHDKPLILGVNVVPAPQYITG